MTKPTIPAIGIDLGTTFSVVARHRRPRPADHRGQRRGGPAHAQRRAVRRRGRGGGQGGAEGPGHRGRPRGRVLETRRRIPRLPQGARRQAVSARGDRGLDPQQAPHGRRRADRADRQGGDHRAGLLRRGPPQGHAGRRLHGRLRGAGHHQRADGRRRGLRLPAGLPRPTRAAPRPRERSWSTTSAAARST